MKNTKSTGILVYHFRLMNYYLEKGFFIPEHNYKQLIIFPNEVKQTIHVINKQKTDFVIACYTVISSVENTLNKLHIRSNLHTACKHNLYNDKQDKFDDIFISTIFPY